MSVADVIGPASSGAESIKVYNLNVTGSSTGTATPTQVVVSSGSASGIWAAPVAAPYTITYIGSPGGTALVTLAFKSVVSSSNGAGFITITPTLPTNLLPLSDLTLPLVVIDNSDFVAGQIELAAPSAQIFVSLLSGGNFSGTGPSGYPTFSISYSLPGLA